MFVNLGEGLFLNLARVARVRFGPDARPDQCVEEPCVRVIYEDGEEWLRLWGAQAKRLHQLLESVAVNGEV